MRHATRMLLVVAAAAALVAPGSAHAAEDLAAEDLAVSGATARFDVHSRTGLPRHRLKIRGTLRSLDAARAFDPTVDAFAVTVAGAAVLSSEPTGDPAGFRFRRRRDGELRSWRLRVKGPAGTVGRRKFSVNVETGRFTLLVERAALTALGAAGPADVTVAVTIGDVAAERTLSFLTRGGSNRVWSFVSAPGGGSGPIGPIPFTALVGFSLSNAPRQHVTVARTQAELVTMWNDFAVPGPLPQVDFSSEMVVTIASLVSGPGQFPPILNVGGVTGEPGRMRIDWQLSLCEESVCPGAPSPCPTASPFQVIRTARSALPIETTQGPTLGVCP